MMGERHDDNKETGEQNERGTTYALTVNPIIFVLEEARPRAIQAEKVQQVRVRNARHELINCRCRKELCGWHDGRVRVVWF